MFDKSPLTAEYLVKDQSYNYNWVSSRKGEQVRNALVHHVEGQQSYYVGMTRINEDVFVGKVVPGEGLFFIDPYGQRKLTNSYQVLTCTSSEVDNGISQEDCDECWYGQFWCPPQKRWDHDEEKCVCRVQFYDEDRDSVWDDETCEYK